MIFNTSEGYKVKRIGREKKLYYANRRGFFFRAYNRRYYLDDIMRLSYPLFYDDQDGKQGVIGGYFSSGYSGFLVEIIDGGEAVCIYEELFDEEV